MAIIINFGGASLRKPGAYSRTKIASGGAADAQLGVMAIIGETEEGPAFDTANISKSAFGPDQFQDIINNYGSGELVDMAKLALSPSLDPQISGGAQQLFFIKTNVGTKASKVLPTTYGTVSYKKAGTPGNQVYLKVDVTGLTVIITVAKPNEGISEISGTLGNKVAMTLTCTDGVASAATLTIAAGILTTAITGGSASPLSIKLSDFSTIGQLVDYINSIPLYTAVVGSATGAVVMPTSVLDAQAAVNIKAVVASVKRDLQDVKDFFASSALVDFAATSTSGLPTTLAKSFLAGGLKGATTAAQVTAAFDALLKARINFIVPCFSQDATADIALGLTDVLSTYTISAAVAGLNSHCAQASTIKGKKERQGFAGFKDDYITTKQFCADHSFNRLSLHLQNVDVLTAAGTIVTKQPHALAVISAAMKCAAVVGLSNTFKAPNILGFSVDNGDFDPETQADDAIEANLTFVEKAPGGGFRFVVDNSTYALTKDNWFHARPSVIYAADTAALSIRLNTEVLVGQRNSDVSRATIENLLISVFDSLRASGIIVGDKNTGGKGYKDLAITIEGSVIKISVTLALVENYEFVLSDITVQRASL